MSLILTVALSLSLTPFLLMQNANPSSSAQNANPSSNSGPINYLDKARQETDCDKNVISACFALALMYKDGVNVAVDSQHAIQLMKKVCDTGQDIGCLYLAELTRDPHPAELACNRNYGPACFLVDILRPSSDVSLTKKACELKYGPACTAMGEHLAELSDVGAHQYFENACQLGDGAGCYRFGNEALASGDTTASDAAYKKACDLGFPAPPCATAPTHR